MNTKVVKRHPDHLIAKARTHLVIQDDPKSNGYKVRSGKSGHFYRVIVLKRGATCTCSWATKRQSELINGIVACSHTIAVYMFRAKGNGYDVSAWATVEDAIRQHRTMKSIQDGIVLTARKISPKKEYEQLNFLQLVK